MNDTVEATPDRLTLLTRVIHEVARARRLRADDAQDFAQYVHLKLLERRCDVFERFSGRSSLKTYLTVVVNRLRLDWQRSTLGKWRPSAAAVRLGPAAMELDRLIYRDGYLPADAIDLVKARTPDTGAHRLLDLADRLTPHHRRRFVSESVLDAIAGTPFEDPIERHQRRHARSIVRRELHAALGSLSPDDHRLLAARYGGRRTLQSVARAQRTDPKALYRRCNRVLKQLRRRLECAGVTGPESIDPARA